MSRKLTDQEKLQRKKNLEAHKAAENELFRSALLWLDNYSNYLALRTTPLKEREADSTVQQNIRISELNLLDLNGKGPAFTDKMAQAIFRKYQEATKALRAFDKHSSKLTRSMVPDNQKEVCKGKIPQYTVALDSQGATINITPDSYETLKKYVRDLGKKVVLAIKVLGENLQFNKKRERERRRNKRIESGKLPSYFGIGLNEPVLATNAYVDFMETAIRLGADLLGKGSPGLRENANLAYTYGIMHRRLANYGWWYYQKANRATQGFIVKNPNERKYYVADERIMKLLNANVLSRSFGDAGSIPVRQFIVYNDVTGQSNYVVPTNTADTVARITQSKGTPNFNPNAFLDNHWSKVSSACVESASKLINMYGNDLSRYLVNFGRISATGQDTVYNLQELFTNLDKEIATNLTKYLLQVRVNQDAQLTSILTAQNLPVTANVVVNVVILEELRKITQQHEELKEIFKEQQKENKKPSTRGRGAKRSPARQVPLPVGNIRRVNLSPRQAVAPPQQTFAQPATLSSVRQTQSNLAALADQLA